MSRPDNLRAIRRLSAVFGNLAITALRPTNAYQYLDKRGREARTAANREIEVLSHAYTKAIEWGLTDFHPIRGKVRKLSTPPRTRYIEDWELVEALKIASPMLTAYLHIKLLTGLRRGDLLRLTRRDIRDDGIHVMPHKTALTTGRRVIIEWTNELRSAVDLARSTRTKIGSVWLFSTRKGQPYIREDGSARAWNSLWQRYMARVLRETKVTERFTEHDLRAKCASDASSLERAQQLLTHADRDTTRRIYRRKPERVKPLR